MTRCNVRSIIAERQSANAKPIMEIIEMSMYFCFATKNT